MSAETRLAAAHVLYTRATRKELQADYDAAFQLYVSCAQSCLALIRDPDIPHTCKDSAKALSNKCLQRAEKIKGLRRHLKAAQPDAASMQQDIITISSALPCGKCPPWKDEANSFDPTVKKLPLSELQKRKHKAWERLVDRHASDTPSPTPSPTQLRQGQITNCSVVASLVACLEHNKRFGSSLGASSLYPQTAGRPTLQKDGHYTARFWFNGCYRAVALNDLVPVDEDGQLQCATSASDFWVALVEKAYLGLRNGYAFEGSDPATDLQIIAGLIPEQIRLKCASFRRENTWKLLQENYASGALLGTLGTAPNLQHARLKAQHAYALIDVVEEEGNRSVIVADALPANPIHVAWDQLPTLFESLYLSWDCTRFAETSVMHCTLQDDATESFQLRTSVAARVTSEIFIVLNRHLPSTWSENNVYISLIVQEEQGRPTASVAADAHTLFETSEYSIVKFLARSQATLNIFAGMKGISQANFTLSVYSDMPCQLHSLTRKHTHSTPLIDQWAGGGHHEYPTFFLNPQYAVHVRTKTDVQAILKAGEEVAVNIKIVRSSGRVSRVEPRAVVGDSGAYTRGRTHLAQSLEPGSYVLVCSPFDSTTEGEFKLTLNSTAFLTIETLPQEGAGMFKRVFTGRYSSSRSPTYSLICDTTCSILLRMYLTTAQHPISLQVLDNSLSRTVITTGAFQESHSGVSTGLRSMLAGRYTIVPAIWQVQDASFQLIVYSDERVQIDPL